MGQPEFDKLRVMIGNKQSELNGLFRERAKLDEKIARVEGEMSGLRDAEAAIEGLRVARTAANQ